MGEKHSDNSSILDNLSGGTGHKIYDPDTETSGEGYGSNRQEAVDKAREDLAANRIAKQVEEKTKKND